MNSVFKFMQSAVNDGIFPGAVLLVSYKNTIVFHEAFGVADIETGDLIKKESIFDLASLTKPLATALCAMKLVEQGVISLDQTLFQFLSNKRLSKNANKVSPSIADSIFVPKDKADITLDQLLRHTSGLPAHRPFYEKLILYPEMERKNILRELILKEPLVAKSGKEQIYSDLGYILLAWIIETVSELPLDIFVNKYIYQLLGIRNLFFMPLHNKNQNSFTDKNESILAKIGKDHFIDKNRVEERFIVPTEKCLWRKKTLKAEVHDDNCWAVGGVDGHAGLFGSALSIWTILNEIMNILHKKNSLLIKRDILKNFIAKKSLITINYHPFMSESITAKAFEMVAGFDTPSLKGSSAGKYFASQSIGHLGFTGTSFWLDPVKLLIVILLSNRVHPTRTNQKIKEFRPKIHDLIVESLGLA